MGKRAHTLDEILLARPGFRVELAGIAAQRRPRSIVLEHVFEASSGLIEIRRELIVRMGAHLRHQRCPSRRDLLSDVLQHEFPSDASSTIWLPDGKNGKPSSTCRCSAFPPTPLSARNR